MDADLRQAMHENMLRALARLGSLTDRSCAERTDSWLLIDAGVDMAAFNLAVATGSATNADEAVGLAGEWFQRRGCSFTFLLRDEADGRLIDAATTAGLVEIGREPSMLLAPIRPMAGGADDLAIRTVTTAKDIQRYAEVDAPAWDEVSNGIARTARAFPDNTMLLGEVGGVAVATSMAVVTGRMVGVFNVEVRPDMRRRGYGRAMTIAAIEAGRSLGCRAAALQSREPGLSLYRKLGFERQYSYVSLTRPELRDSAD